MSGPPPRNPRLGMIAGGLFVLAMLGIWLALWRYNRADRQFREKVIAKRYALDEGTSLDDLQIDVHTEPDLDRPN